MKKNRVSKCFKRKKIGEKLSHFLQSFDTVIYFKWYCVFPLKIGRVEFIVDYLKKIAIF